MPAKTRALVIALVLGGIASAIGVSLQMLQLNKLPIGNRIVDLALHVSLLDASPRLGLPQPTYETQPNPNIAIITVDDATFKQMGFPLPRGTYGKLLRTLKAAGARAVAFDIDFIEPDPVQDAEFAAGMRGMPTVLGYDVNTTTGGYLGVQKPAPDLRQHAAAIGYTSVDFTGGYLIGQPLEIDTGASGTNANERLYSFSNAAVATYDGHPLDTASIPTFDVGGGSRMMLLLPPKVNRFQAASGIEQQTQSFAGRGMMSLSDALTSSAADLRPFVKGALVYVGATAQALGDYDTTAGRGRIPGLYINARFADQLMRHYYLRVAPSWLDVALAIVLPLLAALSFSLLRTPIAIAVSFAATLVYAYLNLYFFVEHLFWIDLVHVVLAMLLGTMFVAVYRVLNEGSQRRMVTNLFGMHVSPAIVADILKQDDPRSGLSLKGKRVKATIFYSDIRGFTSMSETMTPEEIYGQLNEYFEEMCKIIFEYGGYVDKFIGDCVMAVFSAPYQTPEDARNAVISAVKQQAKIRELSERWSAEGRKQFTVGMGINTGDVVMGNLGASSRMNYTVIGDNVNVAARLYNVAKGGEIIISETTYEECKDVVEVDELEPVSVKGKSKPIAIYNVKGLKEPQAQPHGAPTLQPA